eukprot:3362635-Prymnesium_polylepis.2
MCAPSATPRAPSLAHARRAVALWPSGPDCDQCARVNSQTALFSATMPSMLADFTRARLHEPQVRHPHADPHCSLAVPLPLPTLTVPSPYPFTEPHCTLAVP